MSVYQFHYENREAGGDELTHIEGVLSLVADGLNEAVTKARASLSEDNRIVRAFCHEFVGSHLGGRTVRAEEFPCYPYELGGGVITDDDRPALVCECGRTSFDRKGFCVCGRHASEAGR